MECGGVRGGGVWESELGEVEYGRVRGGGVWESE